jgi:uncharacterized protein
VQLNLERPDYAWYLRGAEADHALVNERVLRASFVISPEALVEEWPVTDAAGLDPALVEPILAMRPELVLLGTGARQVFRPRRSGGVPDPRHRVEVMTNAAAARTYSVLAGEGRRVVAGFVIG